MIETVDTETLLEEPYLSYFVEGLGIDRDLVMVYKEHRPTQDRDEFTIYFRHDSSNHRIDFNVYFNDIKGLSYQEKAAAVTFLAKHEARRSIVSQGYLDVYRSHLG
jgi:hypothetical protein